MVIGGLSAILSYTAYLSGMNNLVIICELLNDVIDVTNFFIAITSLKDQTLYFPYYIDKTDVDFSSIRDFIPEKSLTGRVVSKRKPTHKTTILIQ